VFLAVMLTVQSAMGQYAAPQLEQAIEASCRISVPMGNGQFASGSGCLYQYADGEGIVVTAAHVVEGCRGSIVLRFGRRSIRVIARVVSAAVRRVRTVGGRYRVEVYDPADVAAVAFSIQDWPAGERLPRPVRFMRRDWGVPKNHGVYSLGFPGGDAQVQVLMARAQGYEPDGHLSIYPGPEQGRSGSAVFVTMEGEPLIIGVVSTRTMETDNSGRVYLDWGKSNGRLVTPKMIWPDKPTEGAAMIGQPTQCGPGGCPTGPLQVPGFGGGGYILPYRADQDKRIGGLEKQSKEQSPGTIPLPPMAPPIDLAPLDARLVAVEKSLTETIERSNVHSEAITKLNATAEKAVALAEMVAKRDEAFGKDLAAIRAEAAKADQAIAIAADAQGKADSVAAVADEAVEKAEAVEGDVAKQLDEENPGGVLARIKARIETRVEERFGSLKETLSGMIGLPTILGGTGLGVGGIALIVAVVALFWRGAGKAAMGEQTTTQWLASKTSNPYDDMAADFLAEKILARVGERLPSVQRKKAAATKAK
jgi:hypothetical protein